MSRSALIPAAAVLLTTGCIPAEDLLELVEEISPEVSFQDLSLTGLDFDGADGEFTFRLDNPNGVGLNLSSFEWALDFDDRPFLDGVDTDGLTIEPWGTTSVVVPVSVDFAELIDLVGVAQGVDSVPWTLHGAFGFEGVFDEVRVPFEHGGDFPALRRPQARVDALRLESVDWWGQEADLAVDVQLDNPGGPIGLDEFFYAISVEGHEVASGWLGSVSGLDGTEARQVSLPVGIDLLESAAAVVEAVVDQEAGVSVGLIVSARVRTPFGTVPWDFDETRTLAMR